MNVNKIVDWLIKNHSKNKIVRKLLNMKAYDSFEGSELKQDYDNLHINIFPHGLLLCDFITVDDFLKSKSRIKDFVKNIKGKGYSPNESYIDKKFDDVEELKWSNEHEKMSDLLCHDVSEEHSKHIKEVRWFYFLTSDSSICICYFVLIRNKSKEEYQKIMKDSVPLEFRKISLKHFFKTGRLIPTWYLHSGGKKKPLNNFIKSIEDDFCKNILNKIKTGWFFCNKKRLPCIEIFESENIKIQDILRCREILDTNKFKIYHSDKMILSNSKERIKIFHTDQKSIFSSGRDWTMEYYNMMIHCAMYKLSYHVNKKCIKTRSKISNYINSKMPSKTRRLLNIQKEIILDSTVYENIVSNYFKRGSMIDSTSKGFPILKSHCINFHNESHYFYQAYNYDLKYRIRNTKKNYSSLKKIHEQISGYSISRTNLYLQYAVIALAIISFVFTILQYYNSENVNPFSIHFHW